MINLDLVSPQQARDLLGAIVGERRLGSEPEATDQVLRCCGGLPLALRIAGARLVANPGWQVADLARRLIPPHQRVDELHVEDLSLNQRLQRGYSRLNTAHQSIVRRLGQSGMTIRDEYVAVDLTSILDDLAERNILNTGPQYRMHELTYLWAHSLDGTSGVGLATTATDGGGTPRA